jgi:fructose-1-phosphate kinase PfkB-like protein
VIITVTLNAAIDKSLSVPSLRLGRRHRTSERRTLPGGKGVNIARILKTLDQPVIATGFAGGPTGTQIVEQLTSESILNDFVRIREDSRTNTALLDPTTGEETEINEQGPSVDEPMSLSCFARSCSTSRAARRSSCSPDRCRATSTTISTRRWCASCTSST